MTTRSPLARALVAAAALAAAAAPRPASAAKADAFAGKVEPVSGQLYRKGGRFEVTPTLTLSLNDAFFHKTMAGVKVGYHLAEWLSLSGQYVTTVNASPTGSAVVCPANQGCHQASETDLYQVPGYVESILGAEVAFSPVYGKLNLFAEKVAHIDLSILAGVDLVTTRKVLHASEAVPGASPGSEGNVGGHVGLGVRIFFSQTFALRAEVKDYIYAVEVPNVATGDGSSRDLQNQLAAELGLSVFFPFRNRAIP
jgi:outer membrane beta-barrel protein